MATHVEFTLPVGVVDDGGTAQREGVMRLATARDEIEPLGDLRVRRNEAYLTVMLLARTVERVGSITAIDESFIESLPAPDFDHLQRVYERANSAGNLVATVACPECHDEFEVDVTDVQDGPPGK